MPSNVKNEISCSTTQWVLKADMEQVGGVDTTDSELVQYWQVEFPILGTYIKPDLTEMEKMVKRIDDFVIKNKLPFNLRNKKGTKENETASRTSAAVVTVQECFPHFPIDGPEIEAIVHLSLGLYYYDDTVEMTWGDKSSVERHKTFVNVYEIYTNVLMGVYPTVEDIPNTIPALKATFYCFHKAQELARSKVPHLSDIIQPFLSALGAYMKAACTMVKETDSGMSMESYRLVRVDDAGLVNWLEFGLFFDPCYPKLEVRNNYLYGLSASLMSWSLGLVNDVFSLRKDIARGQERNFVRILARTEELSLAEAVQKTVKTIEILTKDINAYCKQLLDTFGDSNVEGLIRSMRNVYNGSITYYLYTTRYGKIRGEIVEKFIG